jgi:methylated-DNA-protein-cysteine methyltransferase related protein
MSAKRTRGKRPTGKKSAAKDTLDDKRARVVQVIRALPAGKVSSYGAVARAAGWAGAARQVVQILRQVPGLPWHRVLGSGGAIKLTGESGAEQRFRLRMEGVAFRGVRVDMKRHEFRFLPSETKRRSAPKPQKR